jgi:DNA repair protein RecO (recombination protein O)
MRGLLLRKRPYLESSLLLTLWLREGGKISAIVKGARRMGSPYQGLAEPFRVLWVDCRLRPDKSLYTLWKIEADGPPYHLKGDACLAALYTNRLLLRTLPVMEAWPEFFDHYCMFLQRLSEKDRTGLSWELRCFEKKLLTLLGYGLDCQKDIQGEKIDLAGSYTYNPGEGFYPSDSGLSGTALHLLEQANPAEPPDKDSLFLLKDLMRSVWKAIA